MIPYVDGNLEVVKQYVCKELENHRCDVEIKRDDNVAVTYSNFIKGKSPYVSTVLIDFGGGEGFYTDWIV